MDTFETIRQVLSKKFELPEEKLSREQTLDNLGIDSLALAELMFLLEERFGVEISDNAPISSLQDVVNLVEGLKTASA